VLEAVWLVPALPLAGFLLLVAFGRRLGEPAAGWLATLAAFGSFAAGLVVWLGLLDEPGEGRTYEQVLFDWLPVGGLHVEVGFLVDPLSITMVLFVTGVGAVIHLYSVGYMHGDPEFAKFFTYLNLFIFAMTMLVLGNNLVLTFLGWEGVGACSYFLIAFWFRHMPNAVAGKKAFVTNRVGDFGYMLATFLIFQALGTLTYTEIAESAGALSEVTATAIALLLLLAACGKSAQLPLYMWLPDAMAGPTPVSALIHAATMVTGGVYLLSRMNPIVGISEDALWVIAIVGAATALFAALAALAQHDIKRVLAYSTISQLGYMFLAIGCGAYIAAIFHMVTHAFYKALLFLGAGSVIHGMDGEQDMRRMGGLLKLLPITGATFIVGWLAIIGVPPFSGFWSKDEILVNAWEKSPALWAVAALTALLTAYYMTRQLILVFFGPRRWTDAIPVEVERVPVDSEGNPIEGASPERTVEMQAPDHEVHPHESPWPMTSALLILAAAAAVAGVLNLAIDDKLLVLEHFLEPVFEGTLHHLTSSTATKVALAAVVAALVLIGVLVAYVIWYRRRVRAELVEPRALENALYVDAAVAWTVDRVGEPAFEEIAQLDHRGVDGAVNGVGWVVQWAATGLRRVHSGYVRNYAIAIALGSVLLVVYLLTRATS
jgi:NADH-quinone oxidoreductase subunit L